VIVNVCVVIAGTAFRRGRFAGRYRQPREITMRSLALGLAISALAFPVIAQTQLPPPQSAPKNEPGVGGTSKPGVPGMPGMSSGPTDKSSESGAASGEQGSTAPNPGSAGSDESKVPGLPGNKSGQGEKTPSK